ncbi:hypothetical protein P4K91_21080 [Bacillus anthracis]|uniref:hypothetical protein n=1 Tax=Bacillus anthracis TaxID=1392 RepID=UPI002DBA632E|nr:hypothetical protein [Bacillus anthracis]MEB9907849.1 hypothetical protein [Bacillus anthracis]MEC1955812.1 hypothetical protein [Bacillus anthracis]
MNTRVPPDMDIPPTTSGIVLGIVKKSPIRVVKSVLNVLGYCGLYECCRMYR